MSRAIPIRLAIAASLFAALTLYPTASRAGLNYGTAAAYCSKNSTGSGWCAGSWAGFRANPDPNAYAYAHDGTSTEYSPLSFFASINGASYACTVTPASPPDLASKFNELVQYEKYFQVWWNADGSCRRIEFYSISYHSL